MNKTDIEYVTHTWNPLAMRCAPVSEGCENCWHLSLAKRLAKNPKIPENRQKAYDGGAPVLIVNELNMPSKLKQPAIIGTQFMGDLFHDDVRVEFIDSIWSRMAKCPQHIFLILTKRPEKMAYFVDDVGVFNYGILPNVWLGITAENQKRADERTSILSQIPAAIRFISLEPLLSDIDLWPHLWEPTIPPSNLLSWVIAGAESGPKRRPAKTEWFQNIGHQCCRSGTPFFLKQMDVNGSLIKMPILDGLRWAEYPERLKVYNGRA